MFGLNVDEIIKSLVQGSKIDRKVR